MYCSPYAAAPTVGQATYNSSPHENVKSAFSIPPAHSSTSYLPSVYPNTGIPGTPHHPNVHGTLQNRNWPVLRPTYMPMEAKDTVHFQQRFHYNFSTCPMTFYDSCTQICHSVDHYPYPKRPRIDGGKLKTMTKNSREKAASKVSQKKRTARRKPLASPPPLIRKCEVNSGNDDKKHKTPHLEDPAETKFCTTDKSLKKYSDTTREISKSDEGLTNVFVAESSIRREEFPMSGFQSEPSAEVGTYRKVKGRQKKNTPSEYAKRDTSPLNNNQNDESTSSDGGHKGCEDDYTWFQQPNKPDVEMECSTRSTHHWTPLEETRYRMAMNEDSHQKRRLSFSAKLQHDSAMVRNDNCCDGDVSQGGPNSPQGKKRQTMTLTRQQTLNTSPKDCREKGGVSSDNKTAINDDNAKYPAMSSLEQGEWHTELFERQPHRQLKHSSSMPNDVIHPQLLYYPPSKTNAHRGRSKSCDDTRNLTLKSHASTDKFHKPEGSSYKTQLMQSEKPREQGFKNKFAEYNAVPNCSPTKRRYQQSDFVVCDGDQTSNNVQTNGNEMSSVSSYGVSSKSATQADVRASYQSMPNDSTKSNLNRLPYERHVREQTIEMDQTRTTMTFARPTSLQKSNVSSGSKRGSGMPSNRQNQLLSRQQSCDRIHTPRYSDPSQNTTSSFNNDLSREQCRKSSPVANPDNPNIKTLRQDQNGKSSLTARKDSFNSSGVISLNEFEYDAVPNCSPTKRRYQQSDFVVCDGDQTSHNVQKNGDGMSTVSSHGVSSKSATQVDVRASFQSMPNDSTKSNLNKLPCERHVSEQTIEMDQTRTTMTFARPTSLQRSNLSSGSGKHGSGMPSNRQNQLLLRQQSCDRIHTPRYSDPSQNATSSFNNDVSREQCRKSSPVANPVNPKVKMLRQDQNGKSSLTAREDSVNSSGVISLNELQKRRVKLSEDQNRSNDRPRFDFNDEKDVSLDPIDVVRVKFQEELKRPSTHYHSKLTDTERFEGHQIPIDLPCDEHHRQQKRRFSTSETTVVQCPHNQEPMGELMRYQGQEDHSSNRKLPTPNCENNTSPIHTIEPRVTSGDCDQAIDTLQVQQICSDSRNLPPLPSGSDWDNIDSGCGGYAIDHNALPRIVAVHSIVTEDEALKESNLFSATDKKYWSDLLQKLTVNVNEDSNFQPGKPRKIVKASHTNNLVNRSQVDTVKDVQDVTYRAEKDYSSQQESLNAANLYSNVKKWTLLKYLSSPSKELTIEVKGPMECVEVDEAERKQQSPRRKLTVSELSKKILYTRERIKKEAIPWKKKLLFSLEATFIRRLRKTEKETGEKADIVIDEDKEKEESKEENAEKVKCNKPGRKKKIVRKGVKSRAAIMTKECA